jgi:hypothetical protein
MNSDWKKRERTAGGQLGNKETQGRTEEPHNIEGAAWVPVNSTVALARWAVRTSFQRQYLRTAIEEREAHWPKGQVMAELLSHTTVSPVDMCNVQLSRS